MNQEDKAAREIVRQSTSRASGNRLMAGSAGATTQASTATTTRVDSEGRVRRLFLIDHDMMDDESKYLGGDPLNEP